LTECLARKSAVKRAVANIAIILVIGGLCVAVLWGYSVQLDRRWKDRPPTTTAPQPAIRK
jgi:hypothetical protein